MRIKYFSFCISCLLSFSANAVELLQDLEFARGYGVMAPQKDIFTDRAEREAVHDLPTRNMQDQSPPLWRLVQWGSRQSVAGVTPVVLDNKETSWAVFTGKGNSQILNKRIVLGTKGSFTLELNAFEEFSGNYLTGLEQYWPHLLLAQNIDSRKLDNYQKILLSLDARLLFDHPNKGEGYNPAIHAARFPIAIAVRNTLSGNIFWLTLVVYDDRYPETGFICQKCQTDRDGNESCHSPQSLNEPGRWVCPFDGTRWSDSAEKKGTHKMIFRVPTEAFTRDNIYEGDWSHYEMDLLPYLTAGIHAARDMKNLKGFSPGLNFYELGFFSIGWEITGLNDAAMSVRNLSLQGL